MSDWGLGLAVKNLYGGPSASERNKNEMATIGLMENQFVKENAEKEMAQLKQQQYDKDIQDFANKLLGPDRDKINQRAKILQAGVRDQIKQYGGDMTRFFANGGHKILGDYRSQVINSAEATTYLDNQKNMMQIVAAQMNKETSGRINPNDLQALKDYNDNKGGVITYSGLMNDVKMPDATKYQYGQEIPAEDIYRENKFAIDGNFVMVHGRPPADALEAVNFTKLNYGNKGSNWQYGYQMEKEKTDQQQAFMKEETQRLKNEQDYLVGMAKANAAAGRKTMKIQDASGNEVEVFEDQMPGYKNPDQKEYKGQGGMTQSASEQTMTSISQLGENIPFTDFVSGKALTNDKAKMLNQTSVPIADGEFIAYDQSLPENNITFDWYSTDKKKTLRSKLGNALFNDKFQPVNARKLYGVNATKAASAILGVSDPKVFDTATGLYKGFQPNESDFRANGAKYVDNNDEVDYEALKGDWKFKGIITVGIGQDKKGNESIVMNQMDGNKIHKKNAEHIAAMYNGGTIKMGQAVVMEDDLGNVTYRVAPNNTTTATAIHNVLKDNDNPMPIIESAYNNGNNTEAKTKEVEASRKSMETFWKINANDAATKGSVQTQANMFSTGGVTIKRNDLINGYCGVLATSSGNTSPDDFKNNILNNPQTQFVNYVRELENEGFPMQETLKSAKSDLDVIDAIAKWSLKNGQSDQIPFLQSWAEHITAVNKYRTE